MLAAGMMAGLVSLPLSASADTAPGGSASASALQVKVSLYPVQAVAGQAGPALDALAGALAQLKAALCTSPGNNVPALAPQQVCDELTLPSLPDNLTVQIAHAEDTASLNSAATDLVGGKSSSTPVNTSWTALQANLGTLEQTIAQVLSGNLGDTAGAITDAVSGALAGATTGTYSATIPAIGTAKFNIFGTVNAALPGNGHDQATAVQVSGDPSGPTNGLNVTVDPFDAYAVNAAMAADPSLKLAGPQASAANTVVGVSLPDLVGQVAPSLPSLTAAANLLKTVVSALSNAVADPTQAGSILDTAAAQIPADPAPGLGLQSTLQTSLQSMGTAINGAATSTAGNVPAAVMDPAKQLLSSLAATLDGLNAVIDAASNLQLPDVTNLVSSANDIASAKTVPLAGGGVQSVATSTLGSVSVLPIGNALAQAVNTAVGLLPSGTLSTVTDKTALLSVDGINASAITSVGPAAAACGSGDHPYACGSAGLHTISVLGQSIDLDQATAGLALGPGQEWRHAFDFPGLGPAGSDGWLTLDVTRGVPQIVVDTPTSREVDMAALDIRLINGKLGCDSNSNCSDPLAVSAPSTGNTAGAHTASTNGGSNGIAALSSDPSTPSNLLDIAAPSAISKTSMDVSKDTNQNNPPTPPAGCNGTGSATCPLASVQSITSLPKTGMFGGAALPAGLLLVAVAISLRVVPGLRTRVRRVR